MGTLGYKHTEETKRKIGASNAIALRGKHPSQETRIKMSIASKSRGAKPPIHIGNKNYAWKGDKVGYHALHDWVERNLGKPKRCEHCGLDDPKRMYHWANKSHKYKRSLKDWLRLCVPCHSKYDKQNG